MAQFLKTPQVPNQFATNFINAGRSRQVHDQNQAQGQQNLAVGRQNLQTGAINQKTAQMKQVLAQSGLDERGFSAVANTAFAAGQIRDPQERVGFISDRLGALRNLRVPEEKLSGLATGDENLLRQIVQTAVAMGVPVGPPQEAPLSTQGKLEHDLSRTRDPDARKRMLEGSQNKTEIEKLLSARQRYAPESDAYKAISQRINKLGATSAGTSFSVNPDGSMSFNQGGPAGSGMGNPTKLGQSVSTQDAAQLQGSRETADAAESSANLLRRAGEILPQIDTGSFAPVYKMLTAVAADLGYERAKAPAALLQEFDAISKELGAQSLQLFGGSDTEKELEVAIRTNPELGKTDEANEAISRRKLRAIDIIQRRPDFESAWLQANGSLANPNKKGNYFGFEWRKFQQQSFGIDAPASGGEDALTEEERRELEELERLLGGKP